VLLVKLIFELFLSVTSVSGVVVLEMDLSGVISFSSLTGVLVGLASRVELFLVTCGVYTSFV